jgi:hypothetical protein
MLPTKQLFFLLLFLGPRGYANCESPVATRALTSFEIIHAGESFQVPRVYLDRQTGTLIKPEGEVPASAFHLLGLREGESTPHFAKEEWPFGEFRVQSGLENLTEVKRGSNLYFLETRRGERPLKIVGVVTEISEVQVNPKLKPSNVVIKGSVQLDEGRRDLQSFEFRFRYLETPDWDGYSSLVFINRAGKAFVVGYDMCTRVQRRPGDPF